MDEEWIKTLWFLLYHPKVLHSEKYDHMTLFLYTLMIRRDHHAHVSHSDEKVLYLRNMVWK